MKTKLMLGTLTMTAIGLATNAYAFTAPSISAGLGSNGAGIQSGVVTILGAAQWIGFIVGIAMIIWVGIKYLTAGAGQKAEVKSTMIPILVGAALVALAPTIASWIFGMFAGTPGE